MPDENELWLIHARAAIRAAMTYPEEIELREEYETVLLANYLAETGQTVNLDSASLTNLLNARPKEKVFKLAEDRRLRGFTAGYVLHFLFLLAHSRIPEPSVGKAVHCCKADYRDQKTDREGNSILAVDVQKYWNTHRAAAPLWAAAIVLDQTRGIDTPDLMTVQNIFSFLGLAEAFRLWGESFSPPRTKGAKLFAPGETLVIPQNGRPIPRVTLEPVDQTAYLAKLLAGYQAK